MSESIVETAKIRALNDDFRILGRGHGSILITEGIQALGELSVIRIVLAIREYDNFNQDNDPWNEHDFGSLMIGEHNVFFKIDYYDRNIQAASSNPADGDVTHRALTIMLADEY